MAGFEDLIRTTLGKQGEATPEKRQAIYNSARRALERMIRENNSLDATTIEKQRTRLSEAIRKVESDFDKTFLPLKLGKAEPVSTSTQEQPKAPAVGESDAPQQEQSAEPSPPSPQSSMPPTGVTAMPVPEVKAPDPMVEAAAGNTDHQDIVASAKPREPDSPLDFSAQHTSLQPEVASGTAEEVRVEPTTDPKHEAAPPRHDPSSGEKEQKTSSERPEPELVSPDLIGTPEKKSEEVVASPRPTQTSKTYSGPTLRERRPYAKLLLWAIVLAGIGVSVWWAVNFGPAFINNQLDGSVPNPKTPIESGGFVPADKDGWITVFTPDTNPENLVTGNVGTAELVEIEGRQIARLASNSGGRSNNVLVKVPPGVVEDIKGKAATFEVQLKAVAGEGHQFAFYCQFSKLGTCGRKRFTASKNMETFIFDVLVNDAKLDEGDSAYLAINTDLSGEGRALDVASIRVRGDGP